jgi:hypothetical protein
MPIKRVLFIKISRFGNIFYYRYNKKWLPKTPEDKRLTDEDIETFVNCVKPIAFHILFSNFEEERRNIFNCLATLKPELIIPELIAKLQHASESITEPHRFTACVATLSSCSRPFVEHYPEHVRAQTAFQHFFILSEVFSIKAYMSFDALSRFSQVEQENVQKLESAQNATAQCARDL